MATLTALVSNYNRTDTLPRAVEAMLGATRPPDELILVDDASTDGRGARVVRELGGTDDRIRLIVGERNEGIASRVLQALAMARGDYFYGGGADDFVLGHFFERAMAGIEANPDVGLVFGDMLARREEAGEPARDVRFGTTTSPSPGHLPPARFRQLLDEEPPGFAPWASAIYRTDAYRAIDRAILDLPTWFDAFAARHLGLAHGAFYLPDPCVVWTLSEETISGAVRADSDAQRRLLESAAAMMREPRYRSVFPEEHVARWELRYRLETLGWIELVSDRVALKDLRELREAYFSKAVTDGEPFDRSMAEIRSLAFGIPWLRRAHSWLRND